MRVSELLRRGALKTNVGGILNRIKIRSRRDTLFFEEIGAKYVGECCKSGYEKEMEAIGEQWMALYFKYLLPSAIRSVPPKFFLNTIAKKIWVSIGMMDHFRIEEKDGIFEIKTANEGLTRIIGKNGLMAGFYKGILSSIYGKEFRIIEMSQAKENSRYVFEKTDIPFDLTGKSKMVYDRLNRISGGSGFTLNDAIRARIFELNDNGIYFRGKSISPIENTLFHLIGNRGLLLDKVAYISNEFFGGIVKNETTEKQKATLLKTLLQTMGWGIVNIEIARKNFVVAIKYPAYGLQLDDDNWDFFVQMILGYLRLADENLQVDRTWHRHPKLKITYSR
jgi:predicted RNA-binding protein YlqC (UPF0109 family)